MVVLHDQMEKALRLDLLWPKEEALEYGMALEIMVEVEGLEQLESWVRAIQSMEHIT
jgi:hypothetical protein